MYLILPFWSLTLFEVNQNGLVSDKQKEHAIKQT
jgi:hypothetical protein